MQQIYTGLHCHKLTWLPMSFGVFKGQTVPSIFFDDPGYPEYMAKNKLIETNRAYGRELARQTALVASRAKGILVQNAPRDRFEYLVLKDHKGILARVVTVKKGASMPDEFKGKLSIAVRSPILNANALIDYNTPIEGLQRLASSLRVILFPFISNPKTGDFENLFAISTNFAPERNVPTNRLCKVKW